MSLIIFNESMENKIFQERLLHSISKNYLNKNLINR